MATQRSFANMLNARPLKPAAADGKSKKTSIWAKMAMKGGKAC